MASVSLKMCSGAVSFTTLAFMSVGPSPYVLKNMVLPSLVGAVAYLGWLPASTYFPPFFLDAIRNCSAIAIALLCVLHVLYVGRAVSVRMIYPAPIIGQVLDLPQLRRRALQTHGVERVTDLTSSVTKGARIDALVYSSPHALAARSKKLQQQQQQAKKNTENAGAAAFEQEQQSQSQSSSSTIGFPNAWIVALGGNGELAEANIDTAKIYANALGANAVVFNPRGVGESGVACSGVAVASSQELVADAADVIKYIMKTYDVQEEDIVLFAHSIGGGIAGEIASDHHPRVSVVFDRTFTNLLDAARAMMPQLPQTLVKHGLPAFFGEFPNDENFDKIQHDRKVVSFHREDQIIRYGLASLARLDKFQPGGKYHDFTIELSGRASDPHNSPTEFFASGHQALLRRMAQFLQQAEREKGEQSASASDASPRNKKD